MPYLARDLHQIQKLNKYSTGNTQVYNDLANWANSSILGLKVCTNISYYYAL